MSILESVRVYCNRGWKLVPLHDAGERGKLPRFRDWGSRASRDAATVEGWHAEYPNANWGVLLGPASDIVDVEADSPEAGELLARLVEGVATPSYSSGRGTHYLFRWSSAMSSFPATVVVEGIEFRIGNGRASQSVIPPSRHVSGKAYAWLPGRSPSDVWVAKLPAALWKLLESSRRVSPPLVPNVTPAERSDKGWEFVMGDVNGPRVEDDITRAPGVAEGGRNRELARLIGVDMSRHGGTREGLLSDAIAWGQRCRPEYPADEVAAVVEAFARRDAAGELRHDATRNGATTTANGTLTPAPVPEKPRIEPIPIGELQGDPDVRWLWKGWIAAGYASLLVGEWKSGKSTLIGHLLRAFGGDGGDIGGRVESGTRTLYVAEESNGHLVRRRENMGIRGPIDVLTRSQLRRMSLIQWQLFCGAMAQWVEDRGYQLVVIDTLSAYWPCENENDSVEVSRALDPLRAICGAGAGLLLCHHPRKGNGELNITSSARGSGAILAWPDVLIQFERAGSNLRDHRRLLSGLGRFDGTPAEVCIELSDDGQSYSTVVQKSKDDEALDELLRALENAGDGFTEKELGGHVRGGRTKLQQTLATAMSKGQVARVGGGTKKDPYRYKVETGCVFTMSF